MCCCSSADRRSCGISRAHACAATVGQWTVGGGLGADRRSLRGIRGLRCILERPLLGGDFLDEGKFGGWWSCAVTGSAVCVGEAVLACQSGACTNTQPTTENNCALLLRTWHVLCLRACSAGGDGVSLISFALCAAGVSLEHIKICDDGVAMPSTRTYVRMPVVCGSLQQRRRLTPNNGIGLMVWRTIFLFLTVVWLVCGSVQWIDGWHV